MELFVFFLIGIFATSLSPISSQHIEPILSQSQLADDSGQYKYSYESGLERKVESRSPDGSTHGMYSYIDDAGKVQVVKYTAGVDGFRAEVSSLPIEGARGLPPTHHHHHGHVPSRTPTDFSLNGVLDDTPEVVAARRQHAAAHAAALAVLPKIPQEPVHRGFPGHSGPVFGDIHHNGALGDTPEVIAAKRQHAAAHEHVRKTLPAASHEPAFQVHHGHGVFPSQPIHHGHNDGSGKLAEDIPRSELGETPEVAAAREAHLAAYARAKSSLPSNERERHTFRF